MTYFVRYNSPYTGEPKEDKYHGNTNEEELDNKVFSNWRNNHSSVEMKIYKNDKLIRTYPNQHQDRQEMVRGFGSGWYLNQIMRPKRKNR